jgi:sterol desaturase/sphingolipid hydroxylase (fatty acid hydroxylase superfamily)
MLKIIISIISYDIWFYISHLILHTKYFYKYHREHHKNKINLVFTDTYVGHWFESFFQGLGVFIPYLLGLKYTILQFIITIVFLNIRGMMRHDYRCTWIIGNHHLIHHLYPNYNYGEYWIDYIGNTEWYKCKKIYLE